MKKIKKFHNHTIHYLISYNAEGKEVLEYFKDKNNCAIRFKELINKYGDTLDMILFSPVFM